MARNLNGSTVLITGASTGIGRAAAVEFVGKGARVIAVARDRGKLEALSGELGDSRLVPLPADVADAAAMEAMAARVLAEFGVPDVVVANAGIGLDALFVQTRDDSFRRIFEVNVFGLIRTVRPFLPGMIERGSGRVLFISSVVGKRGLPYYSAYTASKFAVHGLADSLHAELFGTGVSLGVICPSSTESEFHKRQLHEGPKQRRYRPASHTAESVARAIVSMARSRRRERILSPEGKFMTLVDTFAPGLVDRILARIFLRRG
jgi:short-subunit dehydrogenase